VIAQFCQVRLESRPAGFSTRRIPVLCDKGHCEFNDGAVQSLLEGRMPVLTRKMIWMVVTIVLLIATAVAQDQTQNQTGTVIRHVPVQSTSPASGKDMYTAYCATCHGTDGKGNGPAASALKVPPANLTTLSSRNGGKFPSLKVSGAIRGDSTISAHGSKDMPVWGSLFWSISNGHESEVQQRITNLTKYVESLQAK
jgi:mono/diheme cytochrome c family protein